MKIIAGRCCYCMLECSKREFPSLTAECFQRLQEPLLEAKTTPEMSGPPSYPIGHIIPNSMNDTA